MRHDDPLMPVLAIVTVAAIFIFGVLTGKRVGLRQSELNAIAAGVAKFIVDERTGATQFVFITNSIPAK